MPAAKAINPNQFGVTFSAKQCRNFEIDPDATLNWLIKNVGFRRFRLMSYWNEHEKQPGEYDFKDLDKQFKRIEKSEGEITLCLGARQPRWPENHWPEWAWQASKQDRNDSLLMYIEKVVERYKDSPALVSYQLENEALLEDFGRNAEIDRQRLNAELQLIKKLDQSKPVIMTTSTSWGVPIRRPIPDIVGFSFYHTLYNKGAYHQSNFYPWIHRLRKGIIKVLHRKPVFIHELQCEPWGPQAIWEMSTKDQDKSMSTLHITENIRLARAIKAPPLDLWGGEWWYWRHKHGNDSIWETVRAALDT